MYTKITSLEELKQAWVEMFLNNTDRVTKVSDNSVLSAIAYSDAKVGQKTLKELAIVEAHLFPDSAYGAQLDEIALERGVSARFGALGSSTFVRVVGDVGTQYVLNTHVFRSASGISFDLESTVTIPAAGYEYAKVRSQGTGVITNVDPLTINQVQPVPTGHKYVINEYRADGGRDSESDDDFRKRIKEGSNILAQNTLAKLEQAFMKVNENVMKVLYQGIDANGRVTVAIVTSNGVDLNGSELSDLLTESSAFLGLTELRPNGRNYYGMNIVNVTYFPVELYVGSTLTGVDFRVQLYDVTKADDTRKEIQVKMSKYLDPRTWDRYKKVEWDDLLQIVKSSANVKYVPDDRFYPNRDLTVPEDQLPRIKSFVMRDMNGNVLSSATGTVSPVYFPPEPSASFQSTVLVTL